MADPIQTAPCFVCRCEEIAADAVAEAIAAGASTVDDVKRRTKAGMGLCQGIFCVPTIAAMIAAEESAAETNVAPMTARPPVRPVGLEMLADLAEGEG